MGLADNKERKRERSDRRLREMNDCCPDKKERGRDDVGSIGVHFDPVHLRRAARISHVAYELANKRLL